MKLYKDYTKEPNSLFWSMIQENPLRFRKNLKKMSISEKIKTTNNQIKQNKAQYDSDRQNTKI